MTKSHYHPASLFLHWLIFLLFAAALAFIEYRGYLPKGDPLKKSLRNWHMLAGQLALLFFFFRAMARVIFSPPASFSRPFWQTWSRHLVHSFLYALMFALPITGILFTQAGGKAVEFFGWILPHLISANDEVKRNLRELHSMFGNAVYFLVALHAGAAFWHHFYLGDATLRQMLPSRRNV